MVCGNGNEHVKNNALGARVAVEDEAAVTGDKNK